MKLVNTYEVIGSDEIATDWVQLERGENEFTWMPKAEWEALEAQKQQGGTL